MERGDLLSDNGKIFVGQGQAIDENASENCKIIVIGNPANTNALIAKRQAKRIPKENFTAMTKLDHNRALGQIAMKTNTTVTNIKNLCIWGNHSPTMYPDLTNVLINNKKAYDVISDDAWVKGDFLKRVQQRGAEIIKARGSSSAASAASASIDHIREWHNGTNGEWTSFAIPTEGNT
jgi:malate dehydrogenase